MNDEKNQHLNIIQGTIIRLASNSFQIKGWSVVIVSALFALSAADSNRDFALIALFPGVMLWLLDGYFLKEERLFRRLYDHVRLVENQSIDFSMDTLPFSNKENWISCCISKTIFFFHGSIIISCMLVYVVIG